MKEVLIDLVLVLGVACLAYGGHYLHPAAPWLVVGCAAVIVGVLGIRALAIEKAKAADSPKAGIK
jgi:hypothetical protein